MTDYKVKLTPTTKNAFKVRQTETIMPANFVDLNDVSIPVLDSTKNNYPVVYDSTTGKFKIIDPDSVLSAASTSSGVQPGLPQDFLNVLDSDLDNRINIDAGTF